METRNSTYERPDIEDEGAKFDEDHIDLDDVAEHTQSDTPAIDWLLTHQSARPRMACRAGTRTTAATSKLAR